MINLTNFYETWNIAIENSSEFFDKKQYLPNEELIIIFHKHL